MVALELALSHPERVRSLVLADTSYGLRASRLEAWLTGITLPLLRRADVGWQTRLFARDLGRRSPALHALVEPEVYRAI